MIDWFSGLVGYDASGLKLGHMSEVSPEGEIIREWETKRIVQNMVHGSYSEKYFVGRDAVTVAMLDAKKTLGFHCADDVVLYISGNPSKFLQGHNVFGPSVSSLGPLIQSVVRKFPDEVRPIDCHTSVLPCVKRTRVDVTVMVDLGSHQMVHDWLSHAATQTRSRHGRAQQSEGTVYWGKNSRRWALKAYCKFCEMKSHLPAPFLCDVDFRSYVEGMLRIELVLRRPELKDRGTLSEDIIWEFFKKLEVGVMKKENKTLVSQMPQWLAGTWFKWLHGYSVKLELSRDTFYRHRRAILDVTGCDISLSPTEQMRNLESCGITRDVFDAEYLKSRVSVVPDALQPYLFKP